MRLILHFMLAVLLTGCVSTPKVREGAYDAGSFRVRYVVQGPFVPYFTHTYASPAERADGAVFFTAFVRPGFITERHDGAFSIHIMPAHRFANQIKTEEALAAIIPSSLRKNQPDQFVEATIESLGGRTWVIAKTSKSSDHRIVTGAACYSYANSETIVYAGWAYYDGISEGEFQDWFPRIRETLTRITVEKTEPNKAPEPTSTSVTDRADARSAPAALVAHL